LRDQNLGELRNPHGSDCWVRYGSNDFGQNGGANDDNGKDCNYLGSGDYSPEKAGVGGSTPSLATMFSKVLAEIGRQESGKIAARVSAFIFCESVSPKLGRLVRNMGHLRSIRRDSTSYSAGAWLDRTCTVSGLEKF
jgi:hypothetical protein